MNWIIILLILAAAGMVLFSLARGLLYFARTHDAAHQGDGPSAMHLAQNRMMFARVKWQAIAILLLIVLGFVAAAK